MKPNFSEFTRGATDIIQPKEFSNMITDGRKLRIKVGFDPTACDLHLGHTVIINAMRRFQQAGHTVIFLIGDFTAMIGDPTGKNKTRKALTAEEVAKNAETYKEQVFKILDPDKTEVRFNSEWLSKMSSSDIIKLASQYNVARMLERKDFNQRYKNEESIAIHEFLYPLIQGYDSLALDADIEMGGTDQKFNLLVGRHLQTNAGKPPQVAITWPLLEGIDGAEKMSKTSDNFIGIKENSNEMFGKIMSISDDLMWRWFKLLSFKSDSELTQIHKDVEQGKNPRDAKFELAIEIVDRFHGSGSGEKAKDTFIDRFKKSLIPDNLPTKSIECEGNIWICSALTQSGMTQSNSEAVRLIDQGGVKIDGTQVLDKNTQLSTGFTGILQIGKRRVMRIKIL